MVEEKGNQGGEREPIIVYPWGKRGRGFCERNLFVLNWAGGKKGGETSDFVFSGLGEEERWNMTRARSIPDRQRGEGGSPAVFFWERCRAAGGKGETNLCQTYIRELEGQGREDENRTKVHFMLSFYCLIAEKNAPKGKKKRRFGEDSSEW